MDCRFLVTQYFNILHSFSVLCVEFDHVIEMCLVPFFQLPCTILGSDDGAAHLF